MARVFARKLQTTDQDAVPALLGLYTKLPDHHRVRSIFTKLVACVGKWLDKQVFVYYSTLSDVYYRVLFYYSTTTTDVYYRVLLYCSTTLLLYSIFSACACFVCGQVARQPPI